MSADCVVISNHTNKVIEIVSEQDDTVTPDQRLSTINIAPKDSHVIFMDRTEKLTLNKSK